MFLKRRMDIIIQHFTKSPSSTPATPDPEYTGFKQQQLLAQQLAAAVENSVSASMDISQDSDDSDGASISPDLVNGHTAAAVAALRLRKAGAGARQQLPLQLQAGVYGSAKASAAFHENIDYGAETIGTGTIGEDAYFVYEKAVGIFDGVGGWKSNGIDPSEYSGTLAAECRRLFAELHQSGASDDKLHPQSLLEQAYLSVERAQKVIGSSTACVCVLEELRSEMAAAVAAAAVGDDEDSADICSDSSSGSSLDADAAMLDSQDDIQQSAMPITTLSIGDSSCDEMSSSQDDMSFSSSSRQKSTAPTSVAKRQRTSAQQGPRKCLLHTAFVGDSGYMIIRRDTETRECYLLHKSLEQQHYFNAPFQLALVHGRFAHLRNTIFNDKPHDAVIDQHVVQEGDVVVCGTDGLLDNLFDFEILNIVEELFDCHPLEIAREISRRSFERSYSGDETPFEVNARSAGQYFRGGKRDDISCVVARVVVPATSSKSK